MICPAPEGQRLGTSSTNVNLSPSDMPGGVHGGLMDQCSSARLPRAVRSSPPGGGTNSVPDRSTAIRLHEVEQREMIDVLSSTGLFRGLPEVELRKVADITTERSCPPGHHVFLIGDIATEFFVVASGSVRVFIPTADEAGSGLY